MIALSLKADVQGLEGRIAGRAKGLRELFRKPAFGNAVQSYIIGKTTRMVRELGDVGDAPATKSARGVTWRGFKTWTTRKYGIRVPEGTRFYWRGRKRKDKAGRFARQRKKAKLFAARGPLSMEKVWRKRASGRRYSPTSKMMADTGHLLGMTQHVNREIRGGVTNPQLVLKAGTNVKYFAAQHKRRPIWFWYPSEDVAGIRKVIEHFVVETLRRAS